MKTLFKFIISGILALAILCLITLGIGYTGVHFTNPSGVTDYTWDENQFKSNTSEGFSVMRFDKDGFNNKTAFSEADRAIDILIMGSSHMEAVNVPQRENVCARLNEKRPDLFTYNIGMSGHTIYNCVNNLSDAYQTYNPNKLIIIETATVDLDDETMQRVINGDYEKIPSYTSGALFAMQRYVPAIKMLYKKLEEWKERDLELKDAFGLRKNEVIENTDETGINISTSRVNVDASLDDFLAYARSSVDSNVAIAILYAPATSIDADGNLIFAHDKSEVEYFSQACAKNNIIFIDMSDDFESEYKNSYRLPHGFSNSAVGAGHLNSLGHELIANRLVKEDLLCH